MEFKLNITKDIKILFGIVISTILILFGLVYGLLSYSGDISEELISNNEPVYIIKENRNVYDIKYELTHKISKEIDYNGEDFTHLFYQLNVIRNRFLSHHNTMIFFIRIQFVFNILEAILIGLTTVFGLYVVKTGWEKANKHVMYSAFILAGLLTSLETVNKTLNMEQNISENKNYCKIYKNLETDIITYITTGKEFAGEDITIKKYSNFIDQELIRNYDITFDLDNIPDESYNIEYMEK